ncbi:MAG: dTDP-4-dehydrorhamnose 3,5-epimerase [Fidelibacterota bacterium]
MEIIPAPIPEIFVIKPAVHRDERGYFMETYHAGEFAKEKIDAVFVQDNQAKSMKNVLRGLHYQIRYPQGKLIRVLRGEIWDVAVDIRRGSPTFGKWHGEFLSEENLFQMFIPAGFAHGYCVTSETAEIIYKCTDLYHPEFERGIRWNDPQLKIKWPVSSPILSEKDRIQPFMKDLDLFNRTEGN